MKKKNNTHKKNIKTYNILFHTIHIQNYKLLTIEIR